MPGLAYHLPYYATGLRADQLAEAFDELTPELLRLGALEVRVYRSKEDAYRFLQVIQVEDKDAWTRIWNGEAFVRFLRSFGELMFTVGATPVTDHPDLNVVSNVGRRGAAEPIGDLARLAPTAMATVLVPSLRDLPDDDDRRRLAAASLLAALST